MTPAHSDELDITLDRDADVPIGVQLAWALRSRILGGALEPGYRLPALHRLADDLGVNANTIRAVYLRLEQEGLLETRHGSGSYVTGAPGDRRALTHLVAGAARAARDAGVHPRDVAAALYMQGDDPDAPDAEAAARRSLRAQIAALEQALADLLARRLDLASRLATTSRAAAAPRLLGVAELEHERAELLRRLAEAQALLDAPPPSGQPEPQPKPAAKPSRTPATRPAGKAKLRVAPARPS